MARILVEGQCCACCALVIANGDDSGCRDYYGHTHSTPRLSDTLARHANELSGLEKSGEKWTAWAVITCDGEGCDTIAMGPCDLCDGVDGYYDAHTFAIIY